MKTCDMRPKVIVLCGSSRFVDIMAVCAWLLERDEGAITMGLHLLPRWYSAEPIPDHLAEHEGVAHEMDALHLRKIDLADEIFVVNVNNYVGDSTSREIQYAREHDRPVRWFSGDGIGGKVMTIFARFLNRPDRGEAMERAREACWSEWGDPVGGLIKERDEAVKELASIRELVELAPEVAEALSFFETVDRRMNGYDGEGYWPIKRPYSDEVITELGYGAVIAAAETKRKLDAALKAIEEARDADGI